MVNNADYVVESVVVDRGGKLVALVYLDEKAVAALTPEQVKAIPANILAVSNKKLPVYSKIGQVEIVKEPFEKTPKLSIKRFLYS